MIKIGKVVCGNFRHETMQEALDRYMRTNGIMDDDVVNLERDRDNPITEMYIYYRKRDI